MATTTNYGWTTPDDTALVKDGAAAIRTLGSSIDTTLKTQIDAQIPDSLLTTKGDIIAATGASTPARLGVGSNDQILIADSTAATGLKWGAAPSGSMTLISTTTLSGATTTLSSIPSGYKSLYMVVYNFTQTANGAFGWRINGGTGSSYTALADTSGTGSASGTAFSNTYLPANANPNPTTQTGLYTITIPNYTNTTAIKSMAVSGVYTSQGGAAYWQLLSGVGAYNSTAAVTSFSFFTTGTAYTGGTVLLYGVN
jgi:hypothetical protein